MSSLMRWTLEKFPSNDSDQLRKARVLVYCAIWVAPFSIAFAAQYAKFKTPVVHWGGLLVLGVLIGTIPLLLRVIPSVRLFANYYSFLAWMTLAWVPLFDGGIHNQALINYPFVPILAIAFLPRLDVLFWTVMSCLTIIAYWVVETKLGIQMPRALQTDEASQLLMSALVTTILSSAGIFYFYERARAKLHAEVQSQLKELERQHTVIVDQQKMLVQSAQMSALGEMAGGVAHEINNPLAIIRGNTGMIAQVLKDLKNPRVEKSLDIIDNAIVRIKKIVDGLLRFCSGDARALVEKCSIQSVVDHTKPLVSERFASANIQLDFVDHVGNAIVECRPVEIAQVLINLLNNAFDAVNANRKGEGKDWVKLEVDAGPQGKFVDLKLYDSAPGVPEAIREKIFHPFFTTKEIGQGTGLGLSVSLGIIQSHQGELRLSSPEEKKFFLVRLPLASAISSRP